MKTFAGNITEEKSGDTVTISPDSRYMAVSHDFGDQGRGRVSVYHDSLGDASNRHSVLHNSL